MKNAVKHLPCSNELKSNWSRELSSVSEQCEEAADGRPEQEPVPEEAGAAADQGHGGVHVRAHLPAGGVRGQARGAREPPVCPGR